jgi:hypothetical protein
MDIKYRCVHCLEAMDRQHRNSIVYVHAAARGVYYKYPSDRHEVPSFEELIQLDPQWNPNTMCTSWRAYATRT